MDLPTRGLPTSTSISRMYWRASANTSSTGLRWGSSQRLVRTVKAITARVQGTPTQARSNRDSIGRPEADRKSTRLNSSHVANSYAAFCLKKKEISVTFILEDI